MIFWYLVVDTAVSDQLIKRLQFYKADYKEMKLMCKYLWPYFDVELFHR